MAAQLLASRVVLSSPELVSYVLRFINYVFLQATIKQKDS
jgi:DNA anti-recombination protein RmuC